MSLVYSDEYVSLYHGDCRDHLEWLSADVLITDPPYGMDYVSNSSKYGATDPIAGDSDIQLRNDVLRLWDRSRAALVFGTWRIPRPLNDIRQLIIWDKGDSPGMGDLTLPWGPAHEEIYVFGDGWSGKRRPNVYRVPTLPPAAGYRPDHPTPKPVALMEQLIEYAPAGVVADPFAGSGSTLVAARNQGRQAIGVEVSEKYCQVIIDRLSQGVLV
jgi:site-specific DNA-methyltransferase (adenine-specific)